MKKNLILYVCLVVVAISCKTYEEVHYDILRPAEYTVPVEITSLVIVDNSYPFNSDDAHIAYVEGKLVRLDTIKVDTFTHVIASALTKELQYRQFFDTVFVDTTKYNSLEEGSPMKVFQPAEIRSICNKYNVDAVLSLEGAQYGTDIIVQDMGEEYFATMDARGILFWRLYDKDFDKPIYKTAQIDTLFWSGVANDVGLSVSSFPSIREATIELGDYLGYSFANKIVPYWEPITRKIYTTGNPHFVNAAEWLSKDNRHEAEKLWGYLYETGSESVKFKAANNIAVSFEARGYLMKAMEWAYKSYEAGGQLGSDEKNSAQFLYKDLVRRYRDEKKLNDQVGG